MAYDLTKLPKWAQNEIDRLQRNVEHWKAQALAGPETSDTWIEHHAGRGRTPLGEGVHVVFTLPGGHELQVYREGHQLRIAGDGHSAIAAVPQASNVLWVRPVPWVAPELQR